MKKIEKIANWFVRRNLLFSENHVERSKIMLCFYLPIGYSLIAMFAFPLIIANEIWVLIYTTTIGIVLNLFTPFVLRLSESVRISALYFCTLNFVNSIISFVFLGSLFDLASIPYFFLQAVYITFLLGIRWASAFSSIFVLLLIIIYNFDIKGEGFDVSAVTESEYAMSIIFNLILVFSILIYLLKQFHLSEVYAAVQLKEAITRSDELNIELQESNKSIVEQETLCRYKNNDVRASLGYSRTIQNAMLPSKDKLNAIASDSFVVYKPKEIVSNNFYWTGKREQREFWCITECDEIGVPGALVSILGQNLLSEIVLSSGEIGPTAILNQLHVQVRRKFTSVEEAFGVGMNIGLCSYDRLAGVVQFAGANIACYVVRFNGKKLDVIQPNVQMIGAAGHFSSFTNNIIEVVPNDVVIMMTGGYVNYLMKKKSKMTLNQVISDEFVDLVLNNWEKSTTLLESKIDEFTSRGQEEDLCVVAIQI